MANSELDITADPTHPMYLAPKIVHVSDPAEDLKVQLEAPENASLLREWLNINMAQLDLKPTEDIEEDISSIHTLTKMRFTGSIGLMMTFMYRQEKDITKIRPFVIPNIKCILNERDERVELTPPGFKGKLYLPQATLLKRMLELEEGVSYKVNTCGSDKVLSSAVGIIKERFSFGKTFLIPALFCLSFIPKFKKLEGEDIIELGIPCHSSTETITPVNVVICNQKTMKEWVNNIETNTSFTYAKVATIKGLDALEKQVESGKLPQILLVKDGINNWKGERKETLQHFLKIMGSRVFARVVIDDYDMIKINAFTRLPQTLYMWLLSSTCGDVRESIIENTLGYISKTAIVSSFYYGLKCNSDYSSVEFNIPNINYYNSTMLGTDLVKHLANNTLPENAVLPLVIKADVFLSTRRDVPYIYDPNKIKILLSIENKEERNRVKETLIKNGVSCITMDRRNFHKFETYSEKVAITGLIHGVNLGYLTHIIIAQYDYTDSQINQIIGRAQRISRTQNLQVYFPLQWEINSDPNTDLPNPLEI